MKKILLSIALIFAAAVTVGAQNQVVRAFSHRGGRMEYDENTLSAFEAERDFFNVNRFERRFCGSACIFAR